MDLTRRACLTGTLFAVGSSACASPLIGTDLKDDVSLDALARQKGLRFGAAVGKRDMADPHVLALLKKECGIIGAENAFKWKQIQPKQNKYNYVHADRLVGFANKHHMGVRGHALVWTPDKNMPSWTHALGWGRRDAKRADALMKTHIETVCKYYGTKVGAWDVVNEAVKVGSGALKGGLFMRSLGEDYVDQAFIHARAAAPHAKLVYNDFMRWSDEHKNHHVGVLKLLERLKKNNVPIDALGVQAHLRRFPNTENDKHWRGFLKDVSEMGYEIIITEMDVRDTGFPSDIANRDQMVADHTRHFLDITLDNVAVKEIHTWGITDKYTVRRRRDKRKDGLDPRPLPFDDMYRTKPMRSAIARAFLSAPKR